jgi:hypothetical protein
MAGHALGRRNAAPVQSTKLDLSSNHPPPRNTIQGRREPGQYLSQPPALCKRAGRAPPDAERRSFVAIALRRFVAW